MSSHVGEPWCSQHECHPNDCFEEHYPESAKASTLNETYGELRQRVIQEHLKKQAENEGTNRSPES